MNNDKINHKYDGIMFIVVLALIASLVMTMRSCNKYKEALNQPQDVKYIHKTDTIFPPKDTIYSFKKIIIPKYIIVHDSVLKPIYIDSGRCNQLVLYQDSLVDSNLIVYYKDYVQGILRKKELAYKLKVPIKIIDSVFCMQAPRYQLSVGAFVSKNSFAPQLDLSYKSHIFTLGYDLFNKTPVVGYKKTLFKK